ncbi:MAG TPA: c-type cytochrome [Gaiellaceae bacterium]|nr:c-type cytochrome [Gaiellaceae bacterium]
MRHPAVIALVVLLGAGALAACGAEGVTTPTPSGTVSGYTAPTTTFPVTPAFKLKGDAAKGKAIFLANCGSCHTLADAKTTGTIGPNLDSLKPDYQAATAQVTNGGQVMPSFKTQLTTQQIADVAAYVVTSTGGTVP